MMLLQRSAGNRAVVELLARTSAGSGSAPQVQRAILAIDGASDDKIAKAATANCLSNLRTVKSVQSSSGGKVPTTYRAGDARGETYGQGPANNVRADAHDGVAVGKVGDKESLYVLGHGGGNAIAGLDPTALASLLNGAMADLPGTAPYSGKVKLVACYSASLTEDGNQIRDQKGTPITIPYAGQLAAGLSSQRGRCRPAMVEGIAGIAWVDEETGKKTGFDVRGGALNPLEKVYQDRELQPRWMAALTEKDPIARKKAMDDILEAVQVKYPEFKGMQKRVTGPKARAVYAPTYPLPTTSEPWYRSLLSCFGL